MLAAFFLIIGIMMGVGIGWRLCAKTYDKSSTMEISHVRTQQPH